MAVALVMDPTVASHLGEATAARLVREGAQAFCFVCSVRLSTHEGEDAAVSVMRHLDGDVLVFTHPTCAPSQVTFTGRTKGDSETDDVTYMGLVLPSHPEPRAILLFHSDQSEVLRTGDLVDIGVQALLSVGWTLVTSIGKRPPELPGWRVELDPESGYGQIIDASEQSFLDSLPSEPQWRDVAARTGNVTIFAGRVEPLMRERGADQAGLRQLAREGRLVAATVRVDTVSEPKHPVLGAAKKLAGSLRQVMDAPARRAGAAIDPGFLLQFKSDPTLTPALIGRPSEPEPFALLFVDFQEEDPRTAARLRQLLLDRGFASEAADSSTYLLANGTGWSAAVWPSQLMLFAPRDVGLQVVFFERFPGALNWYEAVRERGGLGIVFGNRMGADMVTDLEVMIRSGEAVGMGVPTMTMS